MHVLVAGCGWLGTALARRLVERGDRVTGIRRDPARAEALRALGVEPLAVDLAAGGAAARLPEVDAIVACQAAGADGVEAYRAAYVEANRALLAAAARGGARAFVYTGSTGVFGQRDGSDVDEGSPPAPASASAEVLVEAEALVRGASAGALRTAVVRLSGLYGPGRAGIVDRVRTGRLALGPGDDAWMNFCHREDAISFVLAALERAAPGAVYHGSDAEPTRRREVVAWICGRLGIAPSVSAASAGGPSRRIHSQRTRAALGVSLAYPSFRDGLAPLLGGG
ncbi:NAD-dependent epimerase/dehydratase family protein [Anaeromyxobacter sp. SG17]|uniref:NAD-dependent epimerase/dehydratase family protein n=1 Tax=Anaeromyxobacter sp. SG17 TaxID=2925405 RepID=UPI001F5866C6|nr:NAD-dependent epimerase/dehydratase family protein [Anaeromyxobacter sp. SG17]